MKKILMTICLIGGLAMLWSCSDDKDSYPGMPFTRYFADLIGSGTNVPWKDVL